MKKKLTLIASILLVSTLFLTACFGGGGPVDLGPSEPTVQELYIIAPPETTVYDVGQVFNPEGMRISVLYTNGDGYTTADFSFSPSGALSVNDTEIRINYKGKSVVQPITVAQMTGITVNAPHKTVYFENEFFDTAGMTVLANFSVGAPRAVSVEDVMILPSTALSPRSLRRTDTEVTVRYRGFTDTVSIMVSEPLKPVVFMVITNQPDITEFTAGQPFSREGLEIRAGFNDFTSRVLENYEFSVAPAILTRVTEYVTITFGGQSITIPVTVLEREIDKRGVGYGFTTANSTGAYNDPAKRTTRTTAEDMALLTSGSNPISWYYNWASRPGFDSASRAVVSQEADNAGLLYFPMAWNADPNSLPEIEEYIVSRLGTPHAVEYMLAYNEPNFKNQANLTPNAAANVWPNFIALAKKYDIKVVSPAMNFSGGHEAMGWNDPIAWLDTFFAHPNVDINDIDAISIHSYPWWPGALRSHVNLYKKYDKPIWITEFCGWEDLGDRTASAELQAWYLSMALTYLEQDPMVERYAWYLPKGHEPQNSEPFHNLLTDVVLNGNDLPALTPLGKLYTNISTFDQNFWAAVGTRIEAEHMTASNQAAMAEDPNLPWQQGVTFRVTTDGLDTNPDSLDIFDFRHVPIGGWPHGSEPAHDMWAEYQINVTEEATYALQLRYQTTQSATVHLTVNDTAVAGSPHTLNSSAWTTGTFSLGTLTAGRHIIRLRVSNGNCALNWLQVNKA
ncbi:MAG: glycosyl hydrolase [Firmicutes bacterium]|nr:glycosyl hydrolase [Bacillota bacterium]